jgi:hypothetical protein
MFLAAGFNKSSTSRFITEITAVDFGFLILLAKLAHQTSISYDGARLAEKLHNFHLLNRVS